MMDITSLAALAKEDEACRVCLNLTSALIVLYGVPEYGNHIDEIFAEIPEAKEQIIVGIEKGSKELIKEACKQVTDSLIANDMNLYLTALNWAEP